MEILDSSNESFNGVDYEARIIEAFKSGGVKSAHKALSNIQGQFRDFQLLTYRQRSSRLLKYSPFGVNRSVFESF